MKIKILITNLQFVIILGILISTSLAFKRNVSIEEISITIPIEITRISLFKS